MDLSWINTGSSLLESTPQELMALYYKTRLLSDLQARFLPTQEQSLDRKLKQLDIMTKKSMLGMPINDNDYDTSVNQDKQFIPPTVTTAAIVSKYLKGEAKPLPALKHFQPVAKNMPLYTQDLRALHPIFGYLAKGNQQPKRTKNLADVLKTFATGARYVK